MRRPRGPSPRKPRIVELRFVDWRWVAWWSPFTGLTPFVRVAVGDRSRDLCTPHRLMKEWKLQRPKTTVPGEMPSLAIGQESVVLSLFPRLSDLVLNPNWDDAVAKGKRCVMLFIDDSATRLLVKMEGDCLKFSCVAHSVDEVLAVAEKLLVTGQIVWEQDAPGGGRGGKKKK